MDRTGTILTLMIFCSFVFGISPGELPQPHSRIEPVREEGRIYWSGLGDLIEATPFFPITINVPDMIYGFAETMSGWYQYFFGGGSSETSSEGGSSAGSTPRIYLRILEQLVDDLR